MNKIIVVKNLRKSFRVKTDIATLFSRDSGKCIKAVDDVSFEVEAGEILGLVGESGSGKTTIGRILVQLDEPDSGEIYISSERISILKRKDRKRFYRNVQMIFQDPYESINPRFTVFETVMEPVRQTRTSSREHVDRVEAALERSGLKPVRNYLHKFPHELSGGERQRLSIARSLVMEPKVLVADEPVSMLDVSIKASILNLLKSFSKNDGVTILYISHDLATVKYLCDRIIFMYLGKFMEVGAAETVIDHPKHPYAQALQAAIPVPDPSYRRERVMSNSLSEKSLQSTSGCRYRIDCKHAMEICIREEPRLREIEPNRLVACHHPRP